MLTRIRGADALREPLMQRWPALNANMVKLAAHADRETAIFACIALTMLVQPGAQIIRHLQMSIFRIEFGWFIA